MIVVTLAEVVHDDVVLGWMVVVKLTVVEVMLRKLELTVATKFFIASMAGTVVEVLMKL